MKSIWRIASGSLLAMAAVGCNQDLTVTNLSNPDVARVFALPSGIEASLASSYQTVHNANLAGNIFEETAAVSFELFSGLNNFNMGPRSGIPRSPIANQSGSPSEFTEYSRLELGARLDANALDALANLVEVQKSTLGTDAQNLRARAMGFFGMGTAIGWCAMIYDSVGVVGPRMSSDSVPPLSGAHGAMAVAISYLDSAYALASNPAATGAGGFPLPAGSSWLIAQTTATQFKQIVSSYRGIFRAGVARTPAERAAVDWNKVLQDTQNGITSDWMLAVDPRNGGNGWSGGYFNQLYVNPTWGLWSTIYMGMADTSGAFANYVATPFATRDASFLVQTPDKRWPVGATRAAQQASAPVLTSPVYTAYPYIDNRPQGNDPSGSLYAVSQYDYNRYHSFNATGGAGGFPEILVAQNNLLEAEADIRLGNIAAAAALIDKTRVPAGLPALSGVVTSATQQVPGGSACVPEVPSGSTVSCGNIMEAMKYEMRMETAYSNYFRFWTDSRGWGDLVTNTYTEYPVPYQEMQARLEASYSLGGGLGSSASGNTYGLP